MTSIRPMFSVFLLCTTVLPAFSQSWATYDQTNSPLPSDRIQSIFVDPGGVKWFGTEAGLVRFHDGFWSVFQTTEDKQTLASDNIRDIDYEVTDSGPELWLATDNGVSVAGIEVDGLTVATPYRTDNTGLLSNSVRSVDVDAEHRRWFGTDDGVSMFDGNTNEWGSFAESVPDYPVTDIGIDNSGGWRYCCTRGGGVGRLKVEVDGITSASVYDEDWSGLMSDNVNTVYVYENGDQWFGTDAAASFHDTTLTKELWQVYFEYNGLADNRISVITVDDRDRVWFGTPAGASVFDWSEFTTYTTADGLAGNNILDIAVDTDGSMWFGTDRGATCFSESGEPDTTAPEIPHGLTLRGNYPNPFTETTTLEFTLSDDAHVTVRITDTLGRIVRCLILENRSDRVQDVIWDGDTDSGIRAASGMYIMRIRAVGSGFAFEQSHKVVLLN